MITQQMSRKGQATAEGTSASQKLSRRKVLLPLILVLAALLMSACGWQGTGVVTGKKHDASYWYTSMICGSYDAKANCVVWVPTQNYVPDYWYVDVRDDKGEVHSVSVNQQYWNSVDNGAKFDNRDEK